ncbi:MAG: hypothetical protein ACRC8C_01080 [Mycoplasmoidaceae bacterium]
MQKKNSKKEAYDYELFDNEYDNKNNYYVTICDFCIKETALPLGIIYGIFRTPITCIFCKRKN